MKNLFFVLSLFSFIILLSCATEITNPKTEPTGKLVLKVDKQNAPANVVNVRAYLTRANYDPLISSLNLLADSTAEILLDDINAGIWHLKVDAEDDSNLVVYTGETDVEIFAGFTSQVYLTLQPTEVGTGSIYIHVTWGVPPNFSWIDYPYNPIITSSYQYFDEYGVTQPQVIYDNGIYRMYYVGIAASAGKYVLYAESNDGINWTKPISHPVLYPGNYGSWDSWAVHPGAVFKDDDGLYKMYYCGYADQYSQWHIGLATSTDGINWTKYSQPILYGTSGLEYQIGASGIIKKNGVYYLYYYNRNLPTYAISVATSSDGINFTKYSGNPILTNQQSWEADGVLYPNVIEENSQLKMVYMNSNGTGFGIATSTDGLNWTKANNNPFVTNQYTANNWAAGKIAYPFWLELPNETRIYYSGTTNYGNELRIGFMRKSNN
jgi:predicted GH43/DUF377 family glycosyl hydrolase